MALVLSLVEPTCIITFIFIFTLYITGKKRRNQENERQVYTITSKRKIGVVERRDGDTPNKTTKGHFARNELDTHTDTSCAGSNWSLLSHTGQLCEVNPFFASYTPLQDVLIARCGTVWTDDTTGRDFMLVGDDMLWFGTTLENSIL
jgi:hypothetical protein